MAENLDPTGALAAVLAALDSLERAGFRPVLAGGYALVLLGSPELTKDFDFVIGVADDPARYRASSDALYAAGFRRVARFDARTGDVLEYLDRADEAATEIVAHRPNVAMYWHPEARTRLDLLFDFPVPAAEVAAAAREVRIEGADRTLRVASTEHLKEMKRLAYAYRGKAKDLRDLEFLEGREEPPKSG